MTQISTKEEKPRLMIVQAENDEIVEKWMAPEIQNIATQRGMSVDFLVAKGALHFECMGRREFPGWISSFVARCLNEP